jgi:hypothetical protein
VEKRIWAAVESSRREKEEGVNLLKNFCSEVLSGRQ